MREGLQARRAAMSHAVRISFQGLIICILALTAGTSRAANGDASITLKVGGTYSIYNVDTESQPRVTFRSNHPFDIETPRQGQLVILGTEQGDGTLVFRQDGHTVDYQVIVTVVAPDAKRLEAGTSPAALNDLHFSTSKDSREPENHSASVQTETERNIAAANCIDARCSRPDYLKPTAAQATSQMGSTTPAFAAQTPPSRSETRRYSTDPSAGSETIVRNEALPPPGGAITLMSGTSRVLGFPSGIKRVSVSDSHIADVQIVNPQQLMLVGHAPGFATLVVWNAQDQYVERQIRIEDTGQQQVFLHVVVAEVNRTRLEQQGVDFSVALTKYGFSLAGLPGMVASPYSSQMNISSPDGTFTGFLPPGGNYYPLAVSPNITYALAGRNSNVSTNAFFQFLEDHNLAKILAEPDLVATSGHEAKFLSGGEIPIIISQALNTSIVFKQYGTSVLFIPTVVGQQNIELLVKPEVSEPDYTHQVSLNGFTVPAFVTRRAETLVRMHQQQTLLIAGLILDTSRSEVKKVPYLGDIPFVGGLFRNTYWDHTKSELVMSVTPRMVEPLPSGAELDLPTEHAPPMSPEDIRTRTLSVPDASRPRF